MTITNILLLKKGNFDNLNLWDLLKAHRYRQ